MGTAPTTRSVLSSLRKARLADVGRSVGFPVPDAPKEAQITRLVRTGRVHFRERLGQLGRDELKAACRAHGIDDSGRARADLQSRLLLAHGEAMDSAPPPALFTRGEILERSRKVMEFRRDLLRDAIDVSLELSGIPPLVEQGQCVYRLPEMPASWSRTVDQLWPPKSKREE